MRTFLPFAAVARSVLRLRRPPERRAESCRWSQPRPSQTYFIHEKMCCGYPSLKMHMSLTIPENGNIIAAVGRLEFVLNSDDVAIPSSVVFRTSLSARQAQCKQSEA